MKHFYALVRKDPDSAYGVSFPDIRGCYSAADDENDIVRNAIDALETWFEDEEMIEPKSLGEIKDLVAEDLAQGAFLVSVPYIVNDHRVTRVNVSIERGVLNAIDEAAKRRNLTRSSFIAQAARREIEMA